MDPARPVNCKDSTQLWRMLMFDSSTIVIVLSSQGFLEVLVTTFCAQTRSRTLMGSELLAVRVDAMAVEIVGRPLNVTGDAD
jgi:hypothetical protein